MKPQNNIDKYLQNLRLKATAEQRERMYAHISKVWDELQEQRHVVLRRGIWRSVMTSKTVKIAAMLFIVLGIVGFFHLFDKSTKIAFADVVQPILNANRHH